MNEFFIINHQYHKCASQSIKASLKQQVKDSTLFDSHHRTKDIVHYLCKNVDAPIQLSSDQFYPSGDFDFQSQQKYVVCMLRDPYDRWLSNYFQRLLKFKEDQSSIFKTRDQVFQSSLEEAILNLQTYDFKKLSLDYINFMENEFKIFGVCLYDLTLQDFNGYYESPETNTVSIFLRLKHASNEGAKKIMKRFFGVSDWKLLRHSHNAMSDLFQHKNFTYDQFKKKLKINSEMKNDIIEFYEEQPFVQYFLGEEEINKKIQFVKKLEEI